MQAAGVVTAGGTGVEAGVEAEAATGAGAAEVAVEGAAATDQRRPTCRHRFSARTTSSQGISP